LLDTIVGVNVSVAARLITDSKLVDLTTILYDPSSDTYKAITYKSIDPGYLKSSVGLNYSLMPALMLACVVSVLVAWQLHPESIYTEHMRLKGLSIARECELLVRR